MGTVTVRHSFQVQLLQIPRMLFFLVNLYFLSPKCIIVVVNIVSIAVRGQWRHFRCMVMFYTTQLPEPIKKYFTND